MIDMHSHIIPAIDDGAKDMETALIMLKKACENGTTAIVATPHIIEGEWLPAWEDVLSGCERLRKLVRQACMDIVIYSGGEVAIHLDLLRVLSGPGAYCINGGRYMLVELPAIDIPNFTDDFLFTLHARGITPIIAHPERHPMIGKKPELLAEWIFKGALVQMNGSSITGGMGQRTQAAAELLLMNNMVHVVGSDAHSEHRRNTNLSSVVEKINSMIGEKKARQILLTNAKNIIYSREIERSDIGIIKYPKKNTGIRKWLSKWRKDTQHK